MGRKSKVAGFQLEENIDLTQASYNFTESNVINIDNFSYILEWSSLVGTGTIQVQGGIKTSQDQQGVIKWADLDFDPIPVEGATDTALINLGTLGFEYVRLVWTKVDATDGVVTVWVSANTVGA